jgi:hypothetical protein
MPSDNQAGASLVRVAEMLFVSLTPLFVFADPQFDSGSHFTLRMVAWQNQSIVFRLLSYC